MMKLLVSLFVIAVIGFGAYFLTFSIINKKKSKKVIKTKAIGVAVMVCVLLVCLLAFAMYQDSKAPDLQCGQVHTKTTQPPAPLTSAMDYFNLGNYDYESGNCGKAISEYTKSIQLNPKYPQAYNNRAYTYMRMRNYSAALSDLNKALELKPDYIQALMNRGDIHNYYYQIDRQSAVKDYEKVIALRGNQKETSVCGHLLLARHNGWRLGTFLELPKALFTDTCN